MKVMHVITRMIVGGAQENTLLSAIGLAKLPDYEVILATGPQTGPEGNLVRAGVPNVRVVYIPALVREISPVQDLRALFSLRRLFRTERPDVVHTHSSKAGVVGRLAARMAGVPVIVHTLHSLVFHDYQPAWVRGSYRLIKRAMVPFTNHYVSVSDDIRRRAIAAGVGPASAHTTIRSGFETEEFAAGLMDRSGARKVLGLPADRIVVGVVARLSPLKGHDDLLSIAGRVVRESPETLFVFVGGGPLRNKLESRVRQSGLREHVMFLGKRPPEEIPIVFSSFDILAHASLREGLARVIPQGVLAGVPVVCYDMDGASEVIVDGANGFLVPARRLDIFANRLVTLIRDPDARQRIGGASRNGVRRAFSANTMVNDLDLLYRKLAR